VDSNTSGRMDWFQITMAEAGMERVGVVLGAASSPPQRDDGFSIRGWVVPAALGPLGGFGIRFGIPRPNRTNLRSTQWANELTNPTGMAERAATAWSGLVAERAWVDDPVELLCYRGESAITRLRERSSSRLLGGRTWKMRAGFIDYDARPRGAGGGWRYSTRHRGEFRASRLRK